MTKDRIVDSLHQKTDSLEVSVKNVIWDYFGQKGISVAKALTDFAVDFVAAVLILVIGFKLGNALLRFIRRILVRSRVDKTLQTFLVSFLNIAFKVIIIFAAVQKLGVGTSSILALLGSAGIAVGLSLQGSLANIAGGVVLLMLKPFEVGDYIIEEATGKEGTVEAIGIIYTKLLTIENKAVMIPNGTLANTSVTNVTHQEKRTIDLKIDISYSSDFDKVRAVLLQLIKEEPYLVSGPPESIKIFVDSYKDSSIQMGIRFDVVTAHYWEARWRTLERIKREFDKNNIEIPFNQMDIHMR